MLTPRFLCAEYTPIPYTGKPTARLSKIAHSMKVSSRVPHPYAYLRTGGPHSAEGLNRPPPHHPYPTETREAPRRPRRTLSTPQARRNSANPLKPNQIKHSKTWHSYPHQLTTIEVGDKSQPSLTSSH
jgi:hypothetical protein